MAELNLIQPLKYTHTHLCVRVRVSVCLCFCVYMRGCAIVCVCMCICLGSHLVSRAIVYSVVAQYLLLSEYAGVCVCVGGCVFVCVSVCSCKRAFECICSASWLCTAERLYCQHTVSPPSQGLAEASLAPWLLWQTILQQATHTESSADRSLSRVLIGYSGLPAWQSLAWAKRSPAEWSWVERCRVFVFFLSQRVVIVLCCELCCGLLCR